MEEEGEAREEAGVAREKLLKPALPLLSLYEGTLRSSMTVKYRNKAPQGTFIKVHSL